MRLKGKKNERFISYQFSQVLAFGSEKRLFDSFHKPTSSTFSVPDFQLGIRKNKN
jgi:hypothetical protein